MLAIEHKLAHPHRQNLKRDIGESLSATKWYDEQDLLKADDGDFEDPDDYEDDGDEDEDGEHSVQNQLQPEDILSQLEKKCEEVEREHQLAKAKEAETPTKARRATSHRTSVHIPDYRGPS